MERGEKNAKTRSARVRGSTTLCKNRLPKIAFFNVEAAKQDEVFAATLKTDFLNNPSKDQRQSNAICAGNFVDGNVW